MIIPLLTDSPGLAWSEDKNKTHQDIRWQTEL